MPTHDHNYWTHGVNTIVEYPDRANLIRHAGWGTLVRQPADPRGQHNNWFHLPLFSPRAIHADSFADGTDHMAYAWLCSVRLTAQLNENAHIREIHIRGGRELIASENVDLRGPNVDHLLDITDMTPDDIFDRCARDYGFTLCVRVEFLSGTPVGQVIFRGTCVKYRHA